MLNMILCEVGDEGMEYIIYMLWKKGYNNKTCSPLF